MALRVVQDRHEWVHEEHVWGTLVCRDARNRRAVPRTLAQANVAPFGAVLMHLRADGRIGFWGGVCAPGEDREAVLSRVLRSELNMLADTTHDFDLITSRVDTAPDGRKTRVSFYAKRVSEDELELVEEGARYANAFSFDTFGPLRVPLTPAALPTFLRNQFPPGAAEMLVLVAVVRHLMPRDALQAAVKAAGMDFDAIVGTRVSGL